MSYKQLEAHEREVIARELALGSSLRAIARRLERDAGTISREVRRHIGADGEYWPLQANQQAHERRCVARRRRKLAHNRSDGVGFKVLAKLRRQWSPMQVSTWLKLRYPHLPEHWVSHTTIYRAIKLLPRGELKRELLGSLRQQGKARASGLEQPVGKPWVHQLIHDRPAEALARDALGHFEGDLVIGKAAKPCAVGVLVERTSRRVKLIKLERRDAYSAYQGFAAKLAHIPKALCQTMTYDQGSEMAEHERLTTKTGIAVYFCDPHSPWQRAGCENTNGLIRQYLPKGMDLTDITQSELDAIAERLNTRPRKVLQFRTPEEVWNAMLAGKSFKEAINIPVTDFFPSHH